MTWAGGSWLFSGRTRLRTREVTYTTRGRISESAGLNRLRNQDLQPFIVVRSRDAAKLVAAESSRWLVIVDDAGAPVAAARPGQPVGSSVVVAHADLLV